MKIIVLLLCVASYAVVRADDEPDSCLKKVGITIAELPELIRDTTPEGTKKLGCLEACVMKKIGLMNDNAIATQFLEEQIDKVVEDAETRDTIRQSVEACAAEAANDDECEVAKNFAKCGLDRLRLHLHRHFLDGLD